MSEAAIHLHVEPLDEGGGYVATSPQVPGLVVEGRSLVEVAELAQHLTRTIVETYLEYGDPLPPGLAALDVAQPIDVTIPVGIL
jgi:predicted RNase H-like HicB family nuclease